VKTKPPSAKRIRVRTPLSERFWEKTTPEPNTGCLLWTGALSDTGYGCFRDPRVGGPRLAHRVAFEATHGDLPPAPLQLDHICKVRACVNPSHLRPVTGKQNMATSPKRLASHCSHGHAWDDGNTYIRKDDGTRLCKRCSRERKREGGKS
jgi:hypothetical protein